MALVAKVAADDLSHTALVAIQHQEVKLLGAQLDLRIWVGHVLAWAVLGLGAVANDLQLIHANIAAGDHDMDLPQ